LIRELSDVLRALLKEQTMETNEKKMLVCKFCMCFESGALKIQDYGPELLDLYGSYEEQFNDVLKKNVIHFARKKGEDVLADLFFNTLKKV
jgi:hypothetical protein